MKKNIENFKIFYSSPLGKVASKIIAKKISQNWTTGSNLRIALIGFGSAYLDLVNRKAQSFFLLIPILHGLYDFNLKKNNLTASVNEYNLPIDDLSLDRLLVIHSFEYLNDHKIFLRESWRALDKNGEIFIIVPHSFGLWRRYYKNNFFALRTFTIFELNSLLVNNFFTPISIDYSLFFPPNNNYFFKKSSFFEKVGSRFFNFFAGVIIIKAKKNYSAAILKERNIIKRKTTRASRVDAI